MMLPYILIVTLCSEIAGRPGGQHQQHHFRHQTHQERHTKPQHLRQKAPPSTRSSVARRTFSQIRDLLHGSTQVMNVYSALGYPRFLVNSITQNIPTNNMNDLDDFLRKEFNSCHARLKNGDSIQTLRRRHVLHLRSHRTWTQNKVETSTPPAYLPGNGVAQPNGVPAFTAQGVTTAATDCSNQQFQLHSDEYKMQCQILGIYNRQMMSEDYSTVTSVPDAFNTDNFTEIWNMGAAIGPLFSMGGNIDDVYKAINCLTKKPFKGYSSNTAKTKNLHTDIHDHVKTLYSAHKHFKTLKSQNCLDDAIDILMYTAEGLSQRAGCIRPYRISKQDCIDEVVNYIRISPFNDENELADCAEHIMTAVLGIKNDISDDRGAITNMVNNEITKLVTYDEEVCKILMAFYLKKKYTKIYNAKCTYRKKTFDELYENITQYRCGYFNTILDFFENQRKCDNNAVVT